MHLSENIAKNLAKKALTKGMVYPAIKTVAQAIGVRMTKQVFADGVASAIPVVGGGLSGMLTFAMFKPCCMKLRKRLMSYSLSDPEYYQTIFSDDNDEGG